MPPTLSDKVKTEDDILGFRLDCWKDIATYLGKAERTVKRWETDRGLPIHRVPGGGRASVYAYPVELDEWLKSSEASDHEVAEDAESQGVFSIADVAAGNSALAGLPMEEARPTWPSLRQRWLPVFSGLLLIGVALQVVALRTTGLRLSNAVPSLFAKSQPKPHLTSSPGVSDSEKDAAHDLYLRGRYEWNQRTPDSLNRALDLFTQAMVHDPDYALAYAGLADTYGLLHEYSTMPENYAYTRATVAAKKAVELDSSLAEAHRALAFAEMYGDWNFVEAEKEFRHAIELNPMDPVARKWYANAFAVPGRFAESLDQIDKAQELDPSSHAILADKGWMLFNAGRTQEGIEILKDVERSVPKFRSPHFYLMMINLQFRDYPTYLIEGQKTAEAMNDPVLRDIIASARIGYARDGERGFFKELYAKQKQYYTAGKFWGTILAKTCVLMGKKQEALQLLEEAYAHHEIYVLSCLGDRNLLTLKDEPRYRALLKKINFPTEPPSTSPAVAPAMDISRLRALPDPR